MGTWKEKIWRVMHFSGANFLKWNFHVGVARGVGNGDKSTVRPHQTPIMLDLTLGTDWNWSIVYCVKLVLVQEGTEVNFTFLLIFQRIWLLTISVLSVK